jgi:hypothetical protein
MRRRLLKGLVPAIPCALFFAACFESPRVNLALDLAPQGLLDQATSVTLSVFDESLGKCDEKTGTIGPIPDKAQQFPLDNSGCAKGVAWCKTIDLDKDGTRKTFAVVAAKANNTIAEGCKTVAVDQDPLLVDIQVHRYSPPPCCGDGTIEPGEQCDTGDASVKPPVCAAIAEDPVCFSDCTSKEILLSVDDMLAPNLKNGPPGSKTNLAIAFGPGGVNNPGMLRAVYEDSDKSASTAPDLHQSYLRQDLYPVTDPFPLASQLMFPVRCNAVTDATGTLLAQLSPSIVAASDDTVVVAYRTSELNGGQTYDIFLSPQTADGCTDIKPCSSKADCQTECDGKHCKPAVKLNSVSGALSEPDVALGPAGTVLVVWSRPGGIFGRVWRVDGSTSSGEIQIAQTGSAPRVAGTPAGFLVVYQGAGKGDIDGIFMRSVDATGKLGAEVAVNTAIDGVQDQPDIATLDDGSAIVVWHSGGDVYFQRFDASGKASPADDQSAPLNTTGAKDSTDQQHPAVAGANGFFTVAWETPNGSMPMLGNIAARFVGGRSGFGYNSVSGQNDEFIATDMLAMGDRHLPAVAMSPLSGFVAIGWEDHAATHSGVWARRFPPPQ